MLATGSNIGASSHFLQASWDNIYKNLHNDFVHAVVKVSCRIRDRWAVWVILLFALIARLYSVNAPLTDGGQERQTQVAMIARNLYRDDLNVLYPRMDIFGPDVGYVTLEFPLQPALMAIAYYFVEVQDIVGRLIVIAFSMGSIVFMYWLAKFFLPEWGALLTTGIYALTPMSIYFGRALFPEALLLFFSLGALYFILRWSEEPQKTRYYVWSLVFAATAILVKAPPGVVMLLPLGAVWWVRSKHAMIRRADLYIYFGATILPIALWALWANYIGPSNPGWNPYQLSAIRRWGIPDAWFTPTFYSWMANSLVFVTLTPVVLLLAAGGIVEARRHHLRAVVYAWLVAMIAFVILTPGAQSTHWNYQVPLIPIGALLAGIGVLGLVNNRHARAIWQALIAHRAVAVGLGALVVWGYVVIYAAVFRDAYDIYSRVPVALEVGKIVQNQVPNEGFLLLIQPAMVPTAQAYYMDRKVHPIGLGGPSFLAVPDVDRWRSSGAIGVVAVDTPYGRGTEMIRRNPELLSYLRANYRQVAETEHYMIYSLP